MYVGDLKLGELQQTFSFNFDTGSSLLWVPTSECIVCTETPTIPKYDTALGMSNSTGDDESLEYLDGTSVRGYYFDTKVDVNGLTINSMKILGANHF